MMMMRYFGGQFTEGLVCWGKGCRWPAAHQSMDICIRLFVIGNFGCDLGPEIVGVCLVSVMAIVFDRNHYRQHFPLRAR
jgi:hypothetical protein